MGIRNRIKGMLQAQVRERLGRFNVRADAPVAPRPATPAPPEPTPTRTVIRPPRLPDPPPAAPEGEGVRICAEATVGADRCTLQVNQQVLPDASWWFEDAESAACSPLAAALLSVDGIDEVILHGPTLVLISDAVAPDWRALSQAAGQVVRAHLEAGEAALPDHVLAAIPDEDAVRQAIQTIIDEEVNPGVAAHSGHITLEAVDGNAVTIRMGGGCQGCSAADLTLRQGIYSAFRRAVPNLGAIYDATDHTAGRNPWFN